MNWKIMSSFLLVGLLVSSCQWLSSSEKDRTIVAKVGNYYLYQEDIQKLLPKDYTLEDSVQIVTPYINNWALKKLLFLKAEENINKEKQEEFEHLVSQYRTDLYTQFYLDLLSQQIDTTISGKERQDFYEANKEVFRLSEDLVQLRYIQLSSTEISPKLLAAFRTYSSKDRHYIDSLAPHFTSSFLNDSVWVRASEVEEKLPLLRDKLKKSYLHQLIEERDSSSVYLVKINNFLEASDYAPMEYAYPTLKQIILNKRKSKYINTLEKEIINSAIEKKQLEIYEQN